MEAQQHKYNRVLVQREGLKVRLVVTMLLAGTAACSAAQTVPESFSLLLKGDGRTWCAYKDPAEFQSQVTALKPTESARITYSSSTLTELTYQIEADSGDWIVIDQYTPSNGEIRLRRANLMAQQNLQIIQETIVHGGKVDPFRVVSVTTLDGKKAELSDVDFPAVPVSTNLLTLPLVQVVAEMRSRSLGQLCKSLK